MKSQNRILTAYLALFISSIIWGVNGPVMKITLQSVPLFSLAFIRFATASLILFFLLRPKLRLRKEDIPAVMFAGLMGITFNISLYFWGLRLTSALNAGIIEAALPLVTLTFLWIFLHAKIGKNLMLGGIVGILGVVTLIGSDFDGTPHLSFFGDFLILSSLVAFMFYEMMLKKLFPKYSPLTLTFYVFLVGAWVFLPAATFELGKYPNWYQHVPPSGVYGILYGIILSSLIAHLCWQWGLSKTPIAKVGFFLYIQPIASTFAAVLLLSETITVPFFLGSILIFVGLFLAESHVHTNPHITAKLQSK